MFTSSRMNQPLVCCSILQLVRRKEFQRKTGHNTLINGINLVIILAKKLLLKYLLLRAFKSQIQSSYMMLHKQKIKIPIVQSQQKNQFYFKINGGKEYFEFVMYCLIKPSLFSGISLEKSILKVLVKVFFCLSFI